ncbi:unnamed protein product, partial [Brenthis ino]
MKKIKFTVNGDHISLSGYDVSPSTSLNDYVRDHLGLTGTKAMCHEGGCGACIVSVTKTHPSTKEKQTIAVNSCLVHILSCHEWDITTIEGVGNRRDGYSEIQTRLAYFNGTQCGYCTPGWVMNMHSLYKGSKSKLTMKQIERSFAGNLCRCTGYRPILDAFKTFATDVDYDGNIRDLEDLHEIKCFTKCMKKCDIEDEWCLIENCSENLLDLPMDDNIWYKAFSVNDVFKVLEKEGTDSYRLVAGNTGKGVYPLSKEPRVYIDIASISSLQDSLIDENLVLGAGLTINQTMDIFKKQMKNDDFAYLEQFHKHLELVANVPVKNIGTIGGNLAMKHAHPEFQSDLFVLFETVNATITLVDMKLETIEMKLTRFLQIDLKDKLILNLKIPPLSNNHLIRTYKIMPRAQNTHAIVNAGFHFQLNPNKTVLTSNIVYGSINPNFNRATDVEKMLKGLPLFSDETLQKALKKLQEDIVPLDDPPEPDPYCRKAIALGLFYKAILSLAPTVSPRYASGGAALARAVSRATQTYDTDKSVWPVNQPVPKLEALAQCAGEAAYAGDAAGARDLHAALVLAAACRADLLKIDASDALKLPGVVAFYSAKDIPGTNNFTPNDVPGLTDEEEIFASKRVSYYGQPIGIIAATSRKLALQAAQLVNVTYKHDQAKPVLSVQDALVAPDKAKRIRQDVISNATDRGTDIVHKIVGAYYVPDQYHFTMETQSCRAAPAAAAGGGGLRVRCATQWMDLVQVAVARAMDLPLNRVEVEVPCVGGGYGGKGSRSALAACACALVARRLGRATALVLPLADNMEAVGKRPACYFEYELGVNEEGVIQYADVKYYSDCGISFNDTSAPDVAATIARYYDTARWDVRGHSVLTDKASTTWCRAPATTEATAMAEHFIHRISHITKRDPADIRKANMAAQHSSLMDMMDMFKRDTKYDERKAQIDEFNSKNAWKKKALQLTVMSFPIVYFGNFPVTISVYHGDGSILISHGGIEMGQGINTKVAQVCAYSLKIPLNMVRVKGADTFTSPNSMATAGSITSESVAFATIKACNELLERLEPVRKEMDEPTWLDIIKKAFEKGIHLQVSAMTSPKAELTEYTVYGVGSAELTLDVLAGTHVLDRVDLLEDTGRSLNPDLDVGQIEGAFMMGLGLWTTERLAYDARGRLLTRRAWTYRPPGACDVPVDFRVAFKRNSLNKNGVLRSKATGEPALVLAVAVTRALHDAIVEARKEYGHHDTEYLHVDTPYSVDNIIKAIAPNIESYKLQ